MNILIVDKETGYVKQMFNVSYVPRVGEKIDVEHEVSMPMSTVTEVVSYPTTDTVLEVGCDVKKYIQCITYDAIVYIQSYSIAKLRQDIRDDYKRIKAEAEKHTTPHNILHEYPHKFHTNKHI